MSDPVYDSFVARFGAEDAAKMFAAAREHATDDAQGLATLAELLAGVRPQEPDGGSFVWALAMCISYECLERFREAHGFSATTDALKDWFRSEGVVIPDELRDPAGVMHYPRWECVA